MSPLVIVLIVLGGMSMLGVGACVLIGGLAYVAASAEPEPAVSAGGLGRGVPTTPPPDPTGVPLVPLDHGEGDEDLVGGEGSGDTPDEDDSERTPARGSSSGGSPSGGSSSGTGGSWWCTASASVRVCGFAGACNYQMVFGNGGGKDRFLASQQAKHACEASARARGASAVCVVQCSPR